MKQNIFWVNIFIFFKLVNCSSLLFKLLKNIWKYKYQCIFFFNKNKLTLKFSRVKVIKSRYKTNSSKISSSKYIRNEWNSFWFVNEETNLSKCIISCLLDILITTLFSFEIFSTKSFISFDFKFLMSIRFQDGLSKLAVKYFFIGKLRLNDNN